jgi:site-specific DNA-cytosine methylase
MTSNKVSNCHNAYAAVPIPCTELIRLSFVVANQRKGSANADATPEKENRTNEAKRKRQTVLTTAALTTKTRGGLLVETDHYDKDSKVQRRASTLRECRASRKAVNYKDDSDYELEQDETTSVEDPMEVDDTDEEILEEKIPKATKKKQLVTNKVQTSKARTTEATAAVAPGVNQDKLQKLQAKMAAERKDLKPQNNPQAMPDQPFVDPVGIDPTHGIVEGVISEQVRKVGGLLKRVAERSQKGLMEKGELQFPIKLQTACSGTDAPSIALSLIQESLDHLYREKSDQKHGFSFSHEMSCEIEPFKQAYIGRNFPGVPLFPDITKLTIEEQVTDVYGRLQRIPKGNLFVAGTSCKDFSMLKSNLRLDIEDKGTSGQTFLAAVEFLEKFEPEFFIFENVDGAPWVKMQEYITGRIQLSLRDDTTAITSSKTKAGECLGWPPTERVHRSSPRALIIFFEDAGSQLKFSVTKEGRYVAEEVPRQVGIRAGALVQGFVRFRDDGNNVQPLKSSATEGSIVTLAQLARLHKINLDQDMLVMEKKIRYCTNLCKLDTKEYGLPQTRNRKYLFGWKSDDPEDDLGIYIDIIMVHLKTPLLYPMDAFLLSETHDRIRCFREALRSGPGLMVKRERATEPDFWDWELSQNLDTPRHMVYRQVYGIEDRSRWLTQWDTRGKKCLPPGCWPELFDCWNMRRLDLIDCFASAAVRDSISRDPLHHSFVWDLSQNVTRTQYRTANVGVSGCVTPGGELFLPHRGRTLMGYEKLLLQGIPFSRLRLGPESEVQLSDLAGNAMSVSVISATLLAAICAPELRRQQSTGSDSTFRRLLAEYSGARMSLKAQNVKKEELKERQKLAKTFDSIRLRVEPLLRKFRLSQKHDDADGRVLAERGDLNGRRDVDLKLASFTEVLRNMACNLAEESYWSSVLCTCESSGGKTKEGIVMECRDCGLSICHHCSDRHQTASHKLGCLNEGQTDRLDPHVFERKLRCAVPSLLRLARGWSEAIADAEGLEISYGFQLQQIDRKRGFWELIYGAWEDFGSGRQVAEIRVRLGRTGTLYRLGAVAYLRCFAPSIRHQEPHRGNLGFHARLVVDSSTENASWEILSLEKSTTELLLIGKGPSPSHRVQAGLTDLACESLMKHTVKAAFKPHVISRNPMTAYHSMWKQWPSEIEVSGNNTVAGTYRRLSCRHTVVHSALWRRDRKLEEPDLYILFRPDVVRSGLDIAVISRTPSYRDIMEVCELHDWIPENALVPKTHTTMASMIAWTPRPALVVDILSPAMTMKIQNKSFHDSVSRASAANCDSILCELIGLHGDLIERLLEHDTSNSAAKVELDIYGKFGTRNAKRLSIVAAPSLEKYAASNALPITFSKWYSLPSTWSFVQSDVYVPERPLERWKVPVKRGKDVVFERYYDPEESNTYYQVTSSEDQICFKMAITLTNLLVDIIRIYYNARHLSV